MNLNNSCKKKFINGFNSLAPKLINFKVKIASATDRARVTKTAKTDEKL